MKTSAAIRNQRASSRKQRKQQHLLDVKVRSRAATRQRNRRVLSLLSGAFLICAATFGAWFGGRYALRRFFWQNPEYNLSEVEIHTDGSLTRPEILEATGIQEGKNIFSFNLSNARKGLMALPQVDFAEIDRVLPNKISIDVTERKPVAWVTGADDGDPASDPNAFLIDRDGTLLRVKNQERDYFHLPIITGVSVENYEAGQAIDLPEVSAALQLLRLTGENPARYQIRSVDVSKGYCLVATDERHAQITFPLDDIQEQLDRLSLLMASVDADNRELQTVNLMVERNVPVTFVPPADPIEDGTAAASSAPAVDAPPASAEPSVLTEPFLSGSPIVKRAQPLHRSGHRASAHTVRRAVPVATPRYEE
jgi:cell division protein FtsQ